MPTQRNTRAVVRFYPDTFTQVTLASGRTIEVRVPGDPYLEVTYDNPDGTTTQRQVELTGQAYNKALRLRPPPTKEIP